MATTASRTAVRAVVECPACGAQPGERCWGARGRPCEANHAERVELVPVITRNPNTVPTGAFREAVKRMAQRDFFDDPLGADAVESTAEEVDDLALPEPEPSEPPAEGTTWGAHADCTGTLRVEEADACFIVTQCDHCRIRVAFRVSETYSREGNENPPEGGRGATTR